MKNILKRGTSLLLVVAMLLSFAVVVGATELASKDARVKIWADTAAVSLNAGENTYVPIYVSVDSRYGIGALQFDVYCDSDSGIELVEIAARSPGPVIGGTQYYNDSAMYGGQFQAPITNGRARVLWSNTTTLDTTKVACWALVKAKNTAVAGSYEIHIGPYNNDTTAHPFMIITVDGQKVKEEHPFEGVTLEDGAAIVYNTICRWSR